MGRHACNAATYNDADGIQNPILSASNHAQLYAVQALAPSNTAPGGTLGVGWGRPRKYLCPSARLTTFGKLFTGPGDQIFLRVWRQWLLEVFAQGFFEVLATDLAGESLALGEGCGA